MRCYDTLRIAHTRHTHTRKGDWHTHEPRDANGILMIAAMLLGLEIAADAIGRGHITCAYMLDSLIPA